MPISIPGQTRKSGRRWVVGALILALIAVLVVLLLPVVYPGIEVQLGPSVLSADFRANDPPGSFPPGASLAGRSGDGIFTLKMNSRRWTYLASPGE